MHWYYRLKTARGNDLTTPTSPATDPTQPFDPNAAPPPMPEPFKVVPKKNKLNRGKRRKLFRNRPI